MMTQTPRHSPRRAATLHLFACALACSLSACANDAKETQLLLTLEDEVADGVAQYVSLLCGCFGPEGDDAQRRCQAEQTLRFPTSACDQAMVRLEEELSLDFLFCLQLDINRASACLIGCDANLIHQCQEAFISVDTLACRDLLSDEQRDALRECGRQRETARRALMTSE
jgi:hypothetical protein